MRIFFSLFAAQTGHYYRVEVNEACPPCLHGDQLMIIRHKGCSDNAQTGKKYIHHTWKKPEKKLRVALNFTFLQFDLEWK